MANTSLRSRFEVGEPLTKLLCQHRGRLDKPRRPDHAQRIRAGAGLVDVDEFLMAADYGPMVLPVNLR